MIYNFLFLGLIIMIGDLGYFLYCKKKYSIDNNMEEIIQSLKEKESISDILVIAIREFDNRKVVFYKKGDNKYIGLFTRGNKGSLNLSENYLVDNISYFKVKGKKGTYIVVFGEESIYANFSIRIVSDREDFKGKIAGENNILKIYPLSKKDKLIYVEKNGHLLKENMGLVQEKRFEKLCELIKR